MDESIEESMLEGGMEPSLAHEPAAALEESPVALSLDMALGLRDTVRPVTAAALKENRQGEGMMPQGSLLKIPVNVQVILGTTRMPLSKVMSLGPGSIVALDKELSEPVVLLVNGNEVARGLIVVVNDKTGQLGISLTEVSSGSSGANSSKPV